MLKIWTDGSCLGNPGPGGWAFVATDDKNIAERSGGEANTTNNRMELTAVIRALTAARRHSEIELHTDSQYVKNGMQSWIKNWPKDIKAFYMKLNDDNETVAAVDFLVPQAGELMGGSQREERYSVLKDRMDNLKMDEEELDWYLKLRQYGGVKHSGFGLEMKYNERI